MNKVRLFAVAAAMGMFASTVSAAEVTARPKDTTQSVTTVELSGGEEIIRAEFGGVVVAPELTVSGYVETRTTKLPSNYSLLGGVGYEGWTSKVAVDNNRDGIVDTPIYTWNADGALTGKDGEFWFYNDAKAFPSLTTTSYYLGQTETGVGGRIVAPGQAKNDGYIMVGNVNDASGNKLNYHGTYANTTAGIDKVVELLITAGKIEEIKSGDTVTGYRTKPVVSKNTTGADDFEKALVKSATYTEITLADVDPVSKDKLGDLKYAIVNLLAGNAKYNEDLVGTGRKVVADYNIATETVDGEKVVDKHEVVYTITDFVDGAYVNVAGTLLAADTAIAAGSVVVIDGNDKVVKVLTPASVVEGSAATAEDKETYNDFRSTTRISVVRQTARYGTEEVDSFKPAALGNEVKYNATFKASSATFEPVYVGVTPTAIHTTNDFDTVPEVNAWISQGNGLYKVSTAANASDKYVVVFNLGAYEFELDYDYVSTAKETITYTLGSTEYTYAAVKLGTEWHPAFATQAEAVDFMALMSRYGLLTSDADKQARRDKFAGLRTWANGDTTKSYKPQNGLDAAKAQQVTFVGERKAATLSNVVITNNASSIDTKQYGVHDLVYTASIDGKAVATKTAKVVIAPKYQRVYKNGKVVDLKAFHLNGNLYAHYAYDYAKNSVTVTFFNTDGVTVASTATNNIK